ncbi:MAG: polyprenol phosphomannose-dependent alpha 1,6 mannosyltransferase MptB [Candidatus Nanopelagicales bacterium]
MTPDRRGGIAGTGITLAFLLRYALPGFAGTALVAVGSLGVGWLPLTTDLLDWPVVDVLRASTAGLLISRGLIFVGIALLLQAWLVLGYDLLSGVRHGVVEVGTVLVAWCLPLVAAPPLFSRDMYSYYAQGKLMAAGFDPYASGVAVIPGWFQDGVDPMWSETPTPYGPLFLLIERGVANFAQGQPFLAVLVFRVVALVGVALLAVYVPRLAFLHGIDPSKAMWLGVLNPLVVMHFVAGGHNDALMAGLVVAGLAVAAERHPIWGAVLVAMAASVKPIALLALPFVGLLWAGARAGWGRRIVSWVWTVLVAGAAFAATALVAGVGFGWVNALGTPGEVRTWLSPPTALGMALGKTLEWFGVTGAEDLLVGVFRLIGTAAALVVVAWLCLRPEGRSPVRGAALAFLAVVVLGPVVQPWYLLWFLPLFAATGLGRRELRWTILLTAAFAVHGMSESSSTSDTLLELTDGISIVAAFAIVGVVLLASPRERRLVLGEAVSHGLHPEDPPGEARARQMLVSGPART